LQQLNYQLTIIEIIIANSNLLWRKRQTIKGKIGLKQHSWVMTCDNWGSYFMPTNFLVKNTQRKW